MKLSHSAIFIAWGSWACALYLWNLWSFPIAVSGILPYLITQSMRK